jgi:Nucleotide-diphospho-sugar transferase/Glycosyl transferase family 2
MTGTAHPTAARPVVALFCTRGMEAFLSNAIEGILRVGIDPGQIIVGCPSNALDSVSNVARLHASQIQVISNQTASENEASVEAYSSFGSRSFTDISWSKVFFVRELIEIYPHVIYADLDISWIRNPLPYLSQVASVYPLAFQTEGLPRFPPALCCGFTSFARSERTITFLDALIAFHFDQVNEEIRIDDQAACQRLIENDLTWLHDIYCLPEALFLNGLGYRNLQPTGETPCAMEGELLPFLFHANWTVGIENKRKLLANTGTWLLADMPPVDLTTVKPGSPATIASDIQAKAEPSPLLTVIYPIFDVRGEAVERVRLWTEEQDFNSQAYRVFVVASTESELDETALRKVLRNQDALFRVPGVGRDADYWNFGAREATTRWLLFVEAHGMPERDSLSALAAWIAANPDGEACNFRIKNFENHRVSRLMKRWFAETQIGWTDPSTWRRVHRTACAMRRDVFKSVGPFEPEYGQFAPPLLSARMHQRGLTISALPTSGIMHDDSQEISLHHDDTADYVQGEMDARAVSDPGFFEKYFGPSPLQGQNMIVPARYARGMVWGLAVAALHRPGQALHLSRQAFALLPAALMSLGDHARLLAAATRADEWLVMHLPGAEGVRWRRFLVAHRRLVRTERMLWIARHPPLPLQTGTGARKWAIAAIGRHAIIGLHALEYFDEKAFRWTHPVFLLRLALTADGVLRLETRNLRPQIGLSDIVVVVGGRIPKDLSLDDAGNIRVTVEAPSTPVGEVDVVVMVRELCEPSAKSEPGRRLGLPLFSVGFERDKPQNGLPPRP